MKSKRNTVMYEHEVKNVSSYLGYEKEWKESQKVSSELTEESLLDGLRSLEVSNTTVYSVLPVQEADPAPANLITTTQEGNLVTSSLSFDSSYSDIDLSHNEEIQKIKAEMKELREYKIPCTPYQPGKAKRKERTCSCCGQKFEEGEAAGLWVGNLSKPIDHPTMILCDNCSDIWISLQVENVKRTNDFKNKHEEEELTRNFQ